MDYTKDLYPMDSEEEKEIRAGSYILRETRNRLNLTQGEMGKALGFTEPKQIGLIESGKAKLKISQQHALNFLLNKDMMRFSFGSNCFYVTGIKYSERFNSVSCKISIDNIWTFDYKERMNSDNKTLVSEYPHWDKDIKLKPFKEHLLSIFKGKEEVVMGVKNHIDCLIETKFQDKIEIEEAATKLSSLGWIPGHDQITERVHAENMANPGKFHCYPTVLEFSDFNEMYAVLKKDGLAEKLDKVREKLYI